MKREACGFEDVRRDERGKYFCRVCGQSMWAGFAQLVDLISPKHSPQLSLQCSSPEQRPAE